MISMQPPETCLGLRPVVNHRLGLPEVSLFSGLGLLLISWGNVRSRSGADGQLLFWTGLLLILFPTVWRLLQPQVDRKERALLLALLSLSLYLVKMLHSPLLFTFHDELVHWKTAQDIQISGRLFQPNPLILTSPLFPGLEIITAAIASASGLSTFAAGILTISIGKVLLVLALFLFYEKISASSYLASLAVLFYTANPSFLFFDAQFSYESLALPLAAFILLLVVRDPRSRAAPGRFAVTLLAILALTVTHHLTAYALVFLLGLIILLAPFQRLFYRAYLQLCSRFPGTVKQWIKKLSIPVADPHLSPAQPSPQVHHLSVLLLTLCSLGWLLSVASFTLSYITPYMSGAFLELLQMIVGEATGRHLFRSFSGHAAPVYEMILGYASVAMILAGCVLGLLKVYRLRFNNLALALSLAVAAYPFSLLFRLTYWGSEASNRASAHLFISAAFVLAIAAGTACRPLTRLRTAVLSSLFCLVFTGQVIIGWPLWARLPGPYLVSADMRSIDGESLAASAWAETVLGAGQRFSSDRVNTLLLGTYGGQRAVTVINDGILVAPVFFATELGSPEKAILSAAQVEYLLVDSRLSSGLPMTEVYFERGEPGGYRHRSPFDPAALAKFDEVPAASRIYDSGAIRIYDLRELYNEP